MKAQLNLWYKNYEKLQINLTLLIESSVGTPPFSWFYLETHRIYKYVIQNDDHSPEQSTEPSRSFTSGNLGSLSAQFTILKYITFQMNKNSSMSSKVQEKTYSALSEGSCEHKGHKTEKGSKATLLMLCLNTLFRIENLVAMEAWHHTLVPYWKHSPLVRTFLVQGQVLGLAIYHGSELNNWKKKIIQLYNWFTY